MIINYIVVDKTIKISKKVVSLILLKLFLIVITYFMNDSKYGLALHTTTEELGLSISNFKGDCRSKIWNLDLDLSSYLHQYLLEFIKPQIWHNLAFISVAKGPGGYTGTRIGVVTARTLAQQLNIPLFGISNLAVLAWSEKDKVDQKTPIAVQMKARRGQLFTAIYRFDNRGLKELLSDGTMTLEVWQKTLAELGHYDLIDAPDNLGFTVDGLLHLAHLAWQENKHTQWFDVVPFYGQHPISAK
jgi:tRNA threonylcarbamoyl adenosine modification protein YeaZ